jgi:hypothetical protein
MLLGIREKKGIERAEQLSLEKKIGYKIIDFKSIVEFLFFLPRFSFLSSYLN